MLKTAISLLTVACVFMHAVMGCCVHHVHGGEACGARSTECHECDHSGCGKSHERHVHADVQDVVAPDQVTSFQCGNCSPDKAAQPVVLDFSHGTDSGLPEMPCEETSCQWTGTPGQARTLLSFDWHFASMLDCCGLTAAPAAWQCVSIGRRNIAPDRLSSPMRVHALDQVWQL